MEAKEVEIKNVEFSESYYEVGKTAKRIYITSDGCGSEGLYDRIHIHSHHGHIVVPAHKADYWTLEE